MIRLPPRPPTPDPLAGEGAGLTASLVVSFNTKQKLNFDSAIYGAASVKDVLRSHHNNKCCYCEKILTDAYGDVEHFRPKTGYTVGNGLKKPGYFWLAYDFDNLLFSCDKCNRSYKKNHFPLLTEASRADPKVRDISGEGSLLLDPVADTPSDHVTFRDEYIVPVGGSVRGLASIRVLGLDRETLNEERRTRLRTVKVLRAIASMAHPEALEATALLAEYAGDGGEFAGCTRAFLA